MMLKQKVKTLMLYLVFGNFEEKYQKNKIEKKSKKKIK